MGGFVAPWGEALPSAQEPQGFRPRASLGAAPVLRVGGPLLSGPALRGLQLAEVSTGRPTDGATARWPYAET
jgi:hypothetical protein